MCHSHRFLQSWADQGCPVEKQRKPCFLNHSGKNFFYPLEVVFFSHFAYEEADRGTQVCLCKNPSQIFHNTALQNTIPKTCIKKKVLYGNFSMCMKNIPIPLSRFTVDINILKALKNSKITFYCVVLP